MPHADGDKVGDLMEGNFGDTLGSVIADLRSRWRYAFDIPVIAGGMAGLALPFGIFDTPIAPLIAFTVVGAISFRCRDAWLQPAKGTFGEALMDVLVATSALLGSELLFMLAAPSLLMPAGPFVPGLAAGVAIASICRMTAHLNQGPDLRARNVALGPFWGIAAIDALWLGAGAVMQLTSDPAVPQTIPGRGQFLGVATIVALPYALRLRVDSMWSLRKGPIVSEKPLSNYLSTDIEIRKNRLWRPGKDILSRLLEASYFVLLAAPMLIAVWDAATQAPVIIDWRQVLLNAGAVLALATLWPVIKTMNLRAIRALEEKRKAVHA
jgi:hypothetical protein